MARVNLVSTEMVSRGHGRHKEEEEDGRGGNVGGGIKGVEAGEGFIEGKGMGGEEKSIGQENERERERGCLA